MMQEPNVKSPVSTVHAKAAADRLHIVYYTDPLCCWSWAFEEVWQQLRKDYPITPRYCMGGMLADWNSYQDQLNAVTRPIQMGPIWMQARQLSGAPFNDRIWFTDPPASSWPACVAVKCAAQQSPEAEDAYLFALREAVMTRQQNIARKEVLLETAAALPAAILDYERFSKELTAPAVIEAFKADLQEISYRNISRFPTLVISSTHSKRALVVTGNRPYSAMADLLEQCLNPSSGG